MGAYVNEKVDFMILGLCYMVLLGEVSVIEVFKFVWSVYIFWEIIILQKIMMVIVYVSSITSHFVK